MRGSVLLKSICFATSISEFSIMVSIIQMAILVKMQKSKNTIKNLVCHSKKSRNLQIPVNNAISKLTEGNKNR